VVSVEVPAGLRVPAIGDDHLLGVERKDFGAQAAPLYQVERPTRALTPSRGHLIAWMDHQRYRGQLRNLCTAPLEGWSTDAGMGRLMKRSNLT